MAGVVRHLRIIACTCLALCVLVVLWSGGGNDQTSLDTHGTGVFSAADSDVGPPIVMLQTQTFAMQKQMQRAANESKLSKNHPCDLQCYVNDNLVPTSGVGFKPLILIGDEWSRRQMFHDIPSMMNSCCDVLLRDFVTSRPYDSALWLTNNGFQVREFAAPPSAVFALSIFQRVEAPACGGVLLVRRKDLSIDPTKRMATALSDTQEVEHFVTELLHFGLDDFRIRLVGPAILSSTVLCVQKNVYVMPFGGLTSGRYFIEAEHLYENGNAFDQTTRDTIPMVRASLLHVVENKGSRGEIAGAQHHNPLFNLYHVQHLELGKTIRKSKFRSSKHFTWDQFTYQSNESVLVPEVQEAPQCSARLQSPACSCRNQFAVACPINEWMRPLGQWYLSHYNTTFPRHLSVDAMRTMRYHHVHFERSDPQAVYRYRLLRSAFPSPLNGFSPGVFSATLSPLKKANSIRIAFVGDSHLRVTFTHFRNYLASTGNCPLEDHMVKSMSGKTCIFSNTIEVDYRNDVLLEAFLQSKDFVADVLVLGMGSWALGGQGTDPVAISRAAPDFGRWKLSKYESFMKAVAQRLNAMLKQRPDAVVVWMTIPAYPLNTRRFSKLKGEHRSNPRIFAFNAVARQVLQTFIEVDRRCRVRIVDSFDVTYPVMHLSLDHNHFTTYPQDAILHLLLNAVVTF